MKRALKVLTSIVMCAVLMISFLSPAFASTEKTAYIIVSGMNTFPLYDRDGNKVWPLSTSTVLKLVGDILPDVIKYLVTKNSSALADSILPVAYDVFEPISCNKDGESVYDLHTDTFEGRLGERASVFTSHDKDEEGVVHAAIDRFGVDNVFFFNYDWRLDPLNHADDLDRFIKNVKEIDNYKKISLMCFSMGGTIVSSYLYKYGSDEIDTVEFCSTAFQGTSIVGELFRGNLKVDIEGLIDRASQLIRNDTAEQFVNYLNKGLTENGFNIKVSDFANNLINEIGERVYRELLVPVFGYMPGLWALSPQENFEDCKEYMLRDNDNKTLLTRIDAYHNIQGKLAETLENTLADTNVYITAQYNMRGVPVADAVTVSNNDFLIDCKYASGGATVSELYSTLGEGYEQKLFKGTDYLSPDGQIDASTCILPDKTWFIRDMAHVDYPCSGDAAEFILDLASSDTQQTVTSTDRSQFMSYDYSAKTLTPVNEETGKNDSFIKRILDFFDRVRRFFYGIFDFFKGK